ncbi:hypothetical protein HHI36_023546 [Cryptolaemus montrouzieri]|uniref:acylglycerol lipase n=1 Tax=Cryptolaemus montrouzieri TaxID=559131 RepID=A0ABD2PHG4_9CUCU
MSTVVEQPNSGCIMKIQATFREFLSWMRIDHSIYPSGIVTPEYSEFVTINSKIKIRCIHINPDSLKKSKIVEFRNEQVKSKILSEEYWFTKWNKSLKTGNCNCSFRRSLRLSLISSQDAIIDQPSVTRIENPQLLSKIRNVDTFVERLIQDTIFEALQEFYMVECLKNNSLGVVNLAFALEEDTAKQKSYTHGELKESQENISTTDNNFDSNKCKHKKPKVKRPVVILFHGIGTSSDVWWTVIKSLVSKGYETVAPDLLGHGFSSAPDKDTSYSFHNLLLQALAVFDNYISSDENRRCILVGHSYGCSFATAVYHHRMGLVSQMILISGGGPTPLAPPVDHDELMHMECFQALVQPLIFCGVNRSLFYPSRGKFFDVCQDPIGIPSHVIQYVKMGQNWPEGDAAFHRRIFVPTLLVHGLQDKQVTLVQECEMERTIPRSFLELIPNAGHMPMLETPEHLTHMILCFLDCWS